MKIPQTYYQQQLEKYQIDLKKLKTKSLRISVLRLFIFAVLIYAIYHYHTSAHAILLILLGGIPVFLFLVSQTENIKEAVAKTREFIKLNQTELKVLNGNYNFLPAGEKFINPEHYFSYDIDLFGQASFFQYINRSSRFSAQKMLADLLTSNDIQHIEKKQNAIKELTGKPDWRQKFLVSSRLNTSKIKTGQVTNWFQKYQAFTDAKMYYGSMLFSLVSLVVLVLFYMHLIPEKILMIWILLGLGIVGKYVKKIHKLSGELDLIMPALHSYKQLMELIETEDFKSKLLQDKKAGATPEGKPVSQLINRFLKLYQQKEYSNNIIIKLVGNALFLYDLFTSYRLEQWMAKHKQEVAGWFALTDFFEAYTNLGGFAFNHPAYVFPKLNHSGTVINAQQFGHPLISASKRVNNEFYIRKNEFYIITGANMAGKSTFLRTVSLGIVMANSGLPVCAQSFDYQPIKLITSMRTSDSLSKEESYFFSELKRLQFIVKEIEKEEYFIVLDEILKGTNSKDKAIGSKKFMEKLIRSNSTGIIATHDLSLCELADYYPAIKNNFFDAEIINDELFFDYRLKTGICQNMNASFLLKKMKITE